MTPHRAIAHALNPHIDVLNSIRHGDHRAFNDLLVTWKPILLYLAAKFRPSWGDAADGEQIASIALFSAVLGFKEGASFATYANTVIVNALQDELRRQPRTSRLNFEDENGFDAEVIEYEDHLGAAETIVAIDDWRENLPLRERFIVDGVFYQNQTLGAVAVALNITKARVSQILKQVLIDARRSLSQ